MYVLYACFARFSLVGQSRMMPWYIPPSTSRNRASASELIRFAKRCGGSSISLHSGAVFSSNPLASRIGSRSTLPSSRFVMWRTLPSGRVPVGCSIATR